eukprot:gene1550-1962_t
MISVNFEEITNVALLAIVSSVRAFECEMCQFASRVTEDLVVRNVTLDDILPILESACEFHSEELSDVCKEIANEYAVQLITGALESESSESTCTNIGFCDSELVGKKWNPVKKLKCSACKHIVKAAEKSIDINFAKHQCKVLGKPLDHVCEKLVGKIFHRVIDALQKKMDPKNICKHLHCC